MKTYIINARIILADSILEGASLLIEDGCIVAINPVRIISDEVVDLSGKVLMKIIESFKYSKES